VGVMLPIPGSPDGMEALEQTPRILNVQMLVEHYFEHLFQCFVNGVLVLGHHHGQALAHPGEPHCRAALGVLEGHGGGVGAGHVRQLAVPQYLAHSLGLREGPVLTRPECAASKLVSKIVDDPQNLGSQFWDVRHDGMVPGAAQRRNLVQSAHKVLGIQQDASVGPVVAVVIAVCHGRNHQNHRQHGTQNHFTSNLNSVGNLKLE